MRLNSAFWGIYHPISLRLPCSLFVHHRCIAHRYTDMCLYFSSFVRPIVCNIWKWQSHYYTNCKRSLKNDLTSRHDGWYYFCPANRGKASIECSRTCMCTETPQHDSVPLSPDKDGGARTESRAMMRMKENRKNVRETMETRRLRIDAWSSSYNQQ